MATGGCKRLELLGRGRRLRGTNRQSERAAARGARDDVAGVAAPTLCEVGSFFFATHATFAPIVSVRPPRLPLDDGRHLLPAFAHTTALGR
eukprot:356317-Chlamydomonas_euryale.AAC.3